MQYKEFREAIELAGEALGRGDLNPQLAKLWFDGSTVAAWDDNIAIKAACPFALEGGVDGELLTRLVARATGEEVAATTKASATVFKIGASSLKVDVRPLEERTFSIYKPNPKAAIKVDPELLKPALEHVLSCVGQSLEKPEYHGVTFALGTGGKDLLIYAGQPQVLVEAMVPLQAKPASNFDYVVLHEKFCRQVVKHCGKEGAIVELHNAVDPNSGGLLVHPDITVFGRSMSSGQQQLVMWDYIGQHLDDAKNWIRMPKSLTNMLDRALIFEGEHHNLELALEVENKRARLRITIEEGGTRLVDLSEWVKISSDVEPVVVKTNAKHLHTGAKLTEICVDSKRIIMQDNPKDGVRITQVAAIIATTPQ